MKFGFLTVALIALVTTVPVAAQEQHPAAVPAATAAPTAGMPRESASARLEEQQESAFARREEATEKADYITPHITDSKHLEVPSFDAAHGFAREIELPSGWYTFHIGSMEVDLSPTKHMVMLWIVAVLLMVVFVGAARSHQRRAAQGLPPKGLAGAIEAMILYMRNDVILPNVGHHGEGFVPYLLTIFFFILCANLLGLVPYMSTATGNISVTAALAGMTFLVIEIAGMRALGKGYINTIIFWPTDMPLLMRVPMSLILSPVELISKITKPFALAIRLFANMLSGHIVVLALVGLIFTFGSLFVAAVPVAVAVAIMLLELVVALIQAFIFTLLSAVFIGLVRESH